MIYLDNNATTKVDKKVLEEMLPYLEEEYANASSMYEFARKPSEALKNATNLNLGGAFAQAFNTEKVEIAPEVLCSAEKCIYNHKKKCIAEDVFVNENALTSVGSPYCETFKENK